MSGAELAEFSEAARFQRDLYLYLRAAREVGGLQLTARGYVARPALRRARATLLAAYGRVTESNADLPEAEDDRLFFLRRLLERLNLLGMDEATERASWRLVATPADQIAAFFARPLAERLQMCARVWVTGGWWLDALDARVAVPSVMTPATPRVALARRRLTEALAGMRPGETAAFPDAASGRSLLRSQRARTRKRTHPPPTDSESVHAALVGPLAWLGFVSFS